MTASVSFDGGAIGSDHLLFVRYERHVQSCTDCSPSYKAHLAWDGKGERPKYCVVGEALWRSYLYGSPWPVSLPNGLVEGAPESACSALEVVPDDAAVPGMPEELFVLLPTCLHCTKLPEDGYASCFGCRSRMTARLREKRIERRAAGLCPICGGIPARSGERCLVCRAKSVARYESLRDGDTCARCYGAKEEPGRPYCVKCLESEARRKRERRATAASSGFCYSCGREPPRPNSRRCSTCIEKGNASARAYGKSRRRSPEQARGPHLI